MKIQNYSAENREKLVGYKLEPEQFVQKKNYIMMLLDTSQCVRDFQIKI